MKNLCLDGVKIGERKHILVTGVLQCRYGKRVQVEELRVRRVNFWENEVFERNGDGSFRTQPAVRDSSDIVLRGERVGDGNGED